MRETLPDQDEIVRCLRSDGEQALARFFDLVRPRLKRIVHFRLDQRLGSRVSDSDVLQETFVRASQRLDQFLQKEEMPFFVWMRLELNQKLQEIHRYHLVSERRDLRREACLPGSEDPGNASAAIAAHLVAELTTPSRLVEKAEQIALLQQALDKMPAIDREIIALRHFEELSNLETARILGIDTSAASKRYLRALQRLKEIIRSVRGSDGF
jgi:RNA polymerase sigma-70 factor (subfamily 1)